MANPLMNFLATHGFKVMLSGFGISAVGLLFYIKYRFEDPAIAQYAFSATIAGFCIYVLGRIFVFINKKKQNSSVLPSNKTKDPL
jgi:hypothetical protein